MKNLFKLIILSLIFLSWSLPIFCMSDEVKEHSEKVVQQKINPKQIRTRDEIADFFNKHGIRPSGNLADIIASYAMFTETEIHEKNKWFEYVVERSIDDEIELIQPVLDRGADIDYIINSGPFKGYTFLMWAIHRGRFKIAEFLINSGANIHIKDKYNKDTLSLCLSLLRSEKWWLELFSIKHKCCAASTDVKETIRRIKSLVALLIKAGVDLNINYSYTEDPEIRQMFLDSMGHISADKEDEEEFCV